MWLTPTGKIIQDNDPYTGHADGVNYPANYPKSQIGELRQIVPTMQPTYDPMAQNCTEATPALVNGVLTQQWSVTASSPASIQTRAEVVVQNYLDQQAQLKGYDSILSACSYAGAVNPFQAEGQSFLAWRGACWQTCHTILAAVQAGTQPMPTASQLIAALPVRV